MVREMKISFLMTSQKIGFNNIIGRGLRNWPKIATVSHCPGCYRQISRTYGKLTQPNGGREFVSILDQPPVLVRAGRKKHGPGLIILALIPVTAFALGTWQVQRLKWKTNLIAKFEDRLVRPPLPLPPRVDPEAIHDFDYRRVFTKGHYRHDKEMLVGPRVNDGKDGFLVITPLERKENGTSILVNRGWIDKKFKDQKLRDPIMGCPQGEVQVEGLLREPFKKNMFTPDNSPEQGKFYFPDVKQMAEIAGSQTVWIEETMTPDLITSWSRESKGIPIGRAPEVNLRNNHAQYIFTWYALSAATTVMLWMVVRKPPPDITRRVRQSQEWS
ncbi:Cytochrome oxidase assembly protein shy1 [Erysiphe necator]|uniref:SURF1-like protein n=1 Tax=Uncinula necator TaxID=52586 RepID=A0A0B1P499_UNCNE|nr:Cytochrome oxidase assembly protein shy1 [Erysiphe necator]KHJ33517.1 putative cox1 assembly protein [Erysiphe necator]